MSDLTPRMSAAQYLAMACADRQATPAAGGARRAGRRIGAAPRRKYGNQTVRGADGAQFDSGKEARQMQALELARSARDDRDRVVDVRRQVTYELVPKQPGERAVKYVADFVVTFADGRVEVQDVKSPPTRANRAYVIKRKLMLAVHGVRISEL
jgi:hypothetical protein